MDTVGLLLLLVQAYSLLVLARVVIGWFPVAPESPVEPVYRAVVAVTEPPLAAIRSVVRPVRMGAGALDLSPLLLLLALQVLAAVLSR